MFVSCNMAKKVRVGRSAFSLLFYLFFMFAKKVFVGKIGGNFPFSQTKVKWSCFLRKCAKFDQHIVFSRKTAKHGMHAVFSGCFYLNKKEKTSAEVGPIF